jgi:hypothetical protein
MALADILVPSDVVNRSNGTVEITDPRLTVYIDDALAQGAMFAPCLQSDSLSDLKKMQATAILADAVLRRFDRDTVSPDSSQVQTQTMTMGPTSKSITFANSAPLGVPLLTVADRDFLATICKSRKAESISVTLPLACDPLAASYPTSQYPVP